MNIKKLTALCGSSFVIAVLTGCVTPGFGPMPSNIGGKEIVKPAPEKFRGQPVLSLTFIAAVDPQAEDAFLEDYKLYHVATDYGVASAINDETAQTNMDGMMAKNMYYALHLAKYLKAKADGDYALILNPVTLKYKYGSGYMYEPFEANMPPADVDLNFFAYVHPATEPSTRGDLITTYGDELAPIVSIRVDPAFRSDLGGTVALSDLMIPFAHNPDNMGNRAQFIDRINVEKYGKTAVPALKDKSTSSGPLEPGKYFSLSLRDYLLPQVPPTEEVLSASAASAWGYDPGTYYAYNFYDGYYKVIMSALGTVDNRSSMTHAQKQYWGSFEPNADFRDIMLFKSDRRKKRFLTKAQQVEIQYLQDRDDNWSNAVLETNDFKVSFNNLRDAEQKARDDYIAAQGKAVAGVMFAILGAAVSSNNYGNNNAGGTAAGVALASVGVGLVVSAVSELDDIDVAFSTAFTSAYNTQKDYIFETAEGERVTIRARDYADFKKNLKEYYEERFIKTPGIPIS